MIGQATGHRRGTSTSPLLGLPQLVMGHTEIVGAANQVHARVQSVQARSCVPTFARQTGESLTEGSIQAFDKSGIEHVPPTRELKQLLCLIEQTISHLAGNLHDSLFLRSLDDRSNVQVRPDL